MARILIYSNTATSNAAVRLRTELEAAGHGVNIAADSTTVSSGLAGVYSLVILCLSTAASAATIAANLKALNIAGMPLLICGPNASESAGTGKTTYVPVSMGLCTTVDVANGAGSGNSVPTAAGVSSGVFAGFTAGVAVNLEANTTSDFGVSYISPVAGSTSYGTGNTGNINGDVNSLAVEKNLSIGGTWTTGARILLLGSMFASGTGDLSANGKTVLRAAVQWALMDPDISAVTVSKLDAYAVLAAADDDKLSASKLDVYAILAAGEDAKLFVSKLDVYAILAPPQIAPGDTINLVTPGTYDTWDDGYPSLTYQYQNGAIDQSASMSDIPGATSEDYVVQNSDKGKYIRLVETAFSTAGNGKGYSNYLGPVLADAAPGAAFSRRVKQPAEPYSYNQNAWNAAPYLPQKDGLGMFDGSLDFVVPAALNGRYMRFTLNSLQGSGAVQAGKWQKNGVDLPGLYVSDTAGAGPVNVKTPAIPVVTGDRFTPMLWTANSFFYSLGSASLPTAGGMSWADAELLPSGFVGALQVRSTNQSLSSGVQTPIAFDTSGVHRYDLGGFWSAGNPTRLTVPSGVTRVRLFGGACTTGSPSGRMEVAIYKNGFPFRGMGLARVQASGDEMMHVASAIVDVTPGDYFELMVKYSAAATLLANTCFLSIEKVATTKKFALAYMSGALSITGGGAYATIACDTEVQDVGGWFSTGPGFTVPADVYRARISANSFGTSAGSNSNLSTFLDGLDTDFGTARMDQTITTDPEAMNVLSGILEVTPGQVLTAGQFDASTISPADDVARWVCVEEVE